MIGPSGLALTDYRAYCGLLGVPVEEALSPLERAAALPAWIGPELCATAPARDRLRRWVTEAGSPVPTPDMIQQRLTFVGDPEIRAAVVQALKRIPPPVVHHVLTVCWVFGGGWSTGGWHAIAPPVPGQLPEPLQLINVTGHSRDSEDVAGVMAHESAHAWLLAPPAAIDELEPVGEREQRHRYLTQMAVAVGRLDVLLQIAARTERLAVACARAWGFTGAGADGAACISATRSRVLEDAAALPPLDSAAPRSEAT